GTSTIERSSMVDFRPLLFLNALALMLLVTAGFASIRQDMQAPELTEAGTEAVIAKATKAEPVDDMSAPVPIQEVDTPVSEAEIPPIPTVAHTTEPEELAEEQSSVVPFEVKPMPEEAEMLAMAEPVTAIDAQPQQSRPE